MSEVGVAQLRRELKDWLARARSGDEVVITDHGSPVARLMGIDTLSSLERLVAEGHVSEPRRGRPHARALKRVRASGAVSDYVIAERESRRG